MIKLIHAANASIQVKKQVVEWTNWRKSKVEQAAIRAKQDAIRAKQDAIRAKQNTIRAKQLDNCKIRGSD